MQTVGEVVACCHVRAAGLTWLIAAAIHLGEDGYARGGSIMRAVGDRAS